MNRPLDGVRVVEMAGIGPGPHACMMLADLGAEVVRVERPGRREAATDRHTLRGRTVVEADLKSPDDLERVRALAARADVLVEGFRPGVMERLGLGPQVLLPGNPRLVYARMTGWGQDGPLAPRAGHDINYISLTGALHAVGPAERPFPPLNLVGDYGGGSMMLVVGVLGALVERARTGEGQVVDAAMVDGASVLVQALLELRDVGIWNDTRGDNLLDGAAPYYRTYRCADGRFMAVGSIEPQFYALLVQGLGLPLDELPDRDDRANWPELATLFAERFAERDRDHWVAVFEDTDACVTPVLTFAEAPAHRHVAARRSLVDAGDGSVVAVRAPRFVPAAGSGALAADRFTEVPPREAVLSDVVAAWGAGEG
ncbi:CaiB/BaiF CoA transferase family protein [Geodermatophilus amargosae]|uniref:CaiB/BaiF CoA transferase family protein n=1 Tax=Geodermatophilus amargosae TaxID=1296565 RepID=UPI0034DE73B4